MVPIGRCWYLGVMNEKERQEQFEELLDRYLSGSSDKRDQKIIDDFLHSYQQEGDWEPQLGDRESAAIRLKGRIDEALAHEGSVAPFYKRSVFKVAASLILLLAAFAVFWQLHSVTKERPIATLTKSTAWGQKSTVVLSDGTTVRLNAGTTFSYPEIFAGEERRVELQGEAFFDVERDESKPFIIETGDLTTQVLGTAFNIKAFDDDPSIEVTVLEGSVGVTPVGKTQEVLRANDQLTFATGSGAINRQRVDADRLLSWREGKLIFEDMTLSEIAPMLERWYGMTIQFENKSIQDCAVYTQFQDQPLQEVLMELELITGIAYTIREDTVTLTGNGCK